jgi:sulfate adenylyltransferase
VTSSKEIERIKKRAKSMPKITVRMSQILDIQNIADGSYSPLKGFLNRTDFLKVINDKTLEDGTVWTVPIILDVTKEQASQLPTGDEVGLVDKDFNLLAVLKLKDKYSWNKEETVEKLFGTKDKGHPGVRNYLQMGDILLGGTIKLIQQAPCKFENFYLKPVETRVLFKEKGWNTVVGFQTRNVPHRGHEYLQKSALETVDGILIHPKLGKKKKGDFKDELILKSYQILMDHYYLKDHAVLSIFPSEMRYMGPREAVFDLLVRKNYGCTHFIVGRDHAGVGDYYDSHDSHRIFDEFPKLGVQPLCFNYAFYCKKCHQMVSEKTCPHSEDYRVAPSGTTIRELIKERKKLPPELMRPEVAEVLINEKDPFVS